MTKVISNLTVELIDDPNEIRACESPKDKPFVRLTFPDGSVFNITTNIGEMLGGAAKGLRLRWEDAQRRF